MPVRPVRADRFSMTGMRGGTASGLAIEEIAAGLRGDPGFVSVEGTRLRAMLGEAFLDEWAAFAESWNHLEIDRYMADGGRFRRRRYARFRTEDGRIVQEPHGPHFQSVEYNRLNGGVDRWFEPVSDAIASHPLTARLLTICHEVFGAASGASANRPAFKVEMHQFRIEPTATEIGKPTPEGKHRDGVDWVFVGLIARTGVAGGVTGIFDERGDSLGAFTLSGPLDAVFLDDRRVRHGVTPIEVRDAGQPAYRDVLVLTFRGAA